METQTLIVIAIVACAAFFFVRRIVTVLKSRNSTSCGCGCGKDCCRKSRGCR